MIVTALLEYGKEKKEVYLDGQFAFVLYKGELSACHIEENRELPREVYDRIMNEILWKRIRQRCLYLLKSMDRTEYQLRTKLRQGFYPEELIDRAIAWLISLHYLDDVRYAESYVRCYGEKKSRREILMDLVGKGVDKELAKTVLEEHEGPDEEALIRKWIEKKKVDLEKASPKERQKLYGFLLRKGFSSSEVSKVLRGAEDFD